MVQVGREQGQREGEGGPRGTVIEETPVGGEQHGGDGGINEEGFGSEISGERGGGGQQQTAERRAFTGNGVTKTGVDAGGKTGEGDGGGGVGFDGDGAAPPQHERREHEAHGGGERGGGGQGERGEGEREVDDDRGERGGDAGGEVGDVLVGAEETVDPGKDVGVAVGLFVDPGVDHVEVAVFDVGVAGVFGAARVGERLADLHVDMLVVENAVGFRGETADDVGSDGDGETGEQTPPAQDAAERGGETADGDETEGEARVHAPRGGYGREETLLVRDVFGEDAHGQEKRSAEGGEAEDIPRPARRRGGGGDGGVVGG